MLEIFVGLAVLWVLKLLFPNEDAAGKADSEIVPFIHPHDHRDGDGLFQSSGDDLDSDWDDDLIDEIIDEDIYDDFIQ